MAHAARLALATLFVLTGCVPPIPEGHFGCADDDDCPPEMLCRVDRCFRATTDAGPGDASMDAGGPDAGPTDAGDGGQDAGPPDAGPSDAGPSDAGASDAGPDAAPCALMTTTVHAVADIVLNPTECRGSIHRGADTYLNVGLGRGIFAFTLPAQAQSALDAGRMYGMHLTLTRALDCGGGDCPAQGGTLVAHPLVAEWAEGSDGTPVHVPYDGADWCRRLDGEGALAWQVPGAMGPNDIGLESGRTSVTADALTVMIPLAPSPHVGTPLDGRLSVLVAPTEAPEDGGAVFVAVAREQMDDRRASLHLAWCPP